MARPEKTIDWNKVDRMIEAQCPAKEIAPAVNLHLDTFYDKFKDHHGMNFADYAGQKSPYGLGLLRLAQFQKAIKGNTQLLLWLGKVLLGQREPDAERNQEQFDKFDNMMQSIMNGQSARNIEDISNNAETKSE